MFSAPTPRLALILATALTTPLLSLLTVRAPSHADPLPIDPTALPADVWELDLGEPPKVDALEGTLGPPRRPQPVRYTAADVHAALATASVRARCIIRHEVGGYGYDPYVVGRAGERGPAQLHPRGMLPLFVQWSGGASPENPYAAIPFVDWAIGKGYARDWSPVRLGRC